MNYDWVSDCSPAAKDWQIQIETTVFGAITEEISKCPTLFSAGAFSMLRPPFHRPHSIQTSLPARAAFHIPPSEGSLAPSAPECSVSSRDWLDLPLFERTSQYSKPIPSPPRHTNELIRG